MEFQNGGGAYLTDLIREAVQNGTRQIMVSGNWEIEQTVKIPSDFTIILQNCHLRMADNTFCNLFTNENCHTPEGRTLAGRDRNIRIVGIGKALLDGGTYNGLHEKNAEKDGRPDISVNNLILFTNVEEFDISGIQLHNQRWWAMNFIFCCRGRIRNIDFSSNPGLITPTYEGYQSILVKNGDGIDLRAGCHDILIENITGFTEDDTVACTNLKGGVQDRYRVEGLSTDLYNVVIRNVCAASYCGIVRILNQGGTKVYNILVDGVMDTSAGDTRIQSERCFEVVRIGDKHLYGECHASTSETMNITVRNVYARGFVGVAVTGKVENLVLDNINGFDGCTTLIQRNLE